jgi:hypothetical protein
VAEELEINGRIEVKRSLRYVWQFPPLDVCREAWEEKYGAAYWSTDATVERTRRHAGIEL